MRMKRLVTCVCGGVFGVVFALSNLAIAQPVSDVVEGAGVKVGEGTVMHPVLGIESGVIYNVFYEEGGASPRTSGLLRIIGELALGSLPAERLQAPIGEDPDSHNYGDMAFRAELSAQYEEWLTTDDNIQSQRDLSFTALAKGIIYPKRALQFMFSDELRRETRPVNFESAEDTDRDINRFAFEIRYRPPGRTLSGSIGYRNVIDYFEDDDQQFMNRILHQINAGAGWQIFPVTKIYFDGSLGFAGPLGSQSTRPSSMPLRLNLGIATALTVKSTINARIGFGKGFYETGPDFTNVTGGAQFGYRFSPHGHLAAMYEYDFHDSINANFYRDHALKLKLEQQMLDRFAISAAAEVRFRLYRGIIMEVNSTETDRSDVIFSVPLGATYNFRDWIAATLDYKFTTVQTDFRYMADMGVLDDPSYTRHSLMAGVRAAY
jgi:hypothetical protein